MCSLLSIVYKRSGLLSQKVCYTFCMRRHVTRYIAHLHTKPEEERIQYAMVGAAAVTGIIFFIWLMFFFAKLNTPTRVIIPAESPVSAQEEVDRILEEAQLGISPEIQDAGIQDLAGQDIGIYEALPLQDEASVQPDPLQQLYH